MSDSDNREPLGATTSEFPATPKLGIGTAGAPPQELRELLQALRDAIRDSGASNDVRLYARFARLVADAFEALLAERDRLQRRALTRGQADILLAVTEGLPEILNDKLIDIVEDR